MKITFWGVRGSIASPGPETAGVGGNTSCVEVSCGPTRFILDAGTGMRPLGESLLKEGPVQATLLLSHLHWDHIQGLPFFLPLYLPSTSLAVVGARTAEWSLEEALCHQMRAPVFPVRFGELPSTVGFRHVKPGDVIHVGETEVRAQKLNHPGGVTAYRIDGRGRSVVYATDTEHYSCVDPALRELAEGADVLVYDAQYTPEEYRGQVGRSKVGWGHSTWEAATAIAEEAGVKQLVLFHHDPQRDDAGVARLEQLARARFRDTWAAREGAVVDLGGVADEQAA
jgi:phosphoribosyl 1,2-cyclic phosphodiesterase